MKRCVFSNLKVCFISCLSDRSISKYGSRLFNLTGFVKFRVQGRAAASRHEQGSASYFFCCTDTSFSDKQSPQLSVTNGRNHRCFTAVRKIRERLKKLFLFLQKDGKE